MSGCYREETRNFSLIHVLLIIQLCLRVGEASGWSEWGGWTDCTRSCGGGTSYRTRKCLPTDGCGPGDSVRYRICNTHPCASGEKDVRAEQCRSYDSVSYKGHRYWKPFIDPESPCSLACVADGGRPILKLTPLILDGISCQNKSDHVCLNGKCLRVGCDGVIASNVTLDECGVCGGDGSSCRKVKVRYKWRVAGYSRCSVSCGEGVQHSSAVCTDTNTGHFVDPRHCAPFKPPPSTRKTCRQPRCIVTHWYEGPWSECSRSCGGGVSHRLIYCVEVSNDGYRRFAHASYCVKSRPASERRCNTGPCPVWYTGEWSPCTATCGSSLQYREVICHHSNKYSCDASTKPEVTRKCSASLPCRRRTGSARKVAPESKIHDTRPAFYTSAWSACSVTCGFGVRTRYVECKAFTKYNNRVRVLGDEQCRGTKPRDREDCFERFCRSNRIPDVVVEPPRDGHSSKDYIWRYAGFTECTKTCMRGRQDSLIECVRIIDRSVVNPSHCSGIPGLPIVSRVCNEEPCPPQWQFGKYGNCSERCGGGTQIKLLRCIYYNAGEYTPTEVPAHKCGARPANPGRTCNAHPCPPDWKVGKWSMCSVTCGKGTKVRKVLCVSRVSADKVEVVDRSRCTPTKPQIRMSCYVKCAKTAPIIKKRRETYMQLADGRKVVVRVGGSAVVIPTTTIIVRCPVKNFNRKLIYWLRDKSLVPLRGRVKALRNGALRIRNSRDPRDAGLYTCVASANNASIIIQFHSTIEAHRKAKIRQKYLQLAIDKKSMNLVNKKSMSNNGTDRVFKDARPPRKSYTVVVMSDWTPCSKTCNGYGVQTRTISCEEMTSRYTRIHSPHVCRKRGVEIPHNKKVCHVSAPCPRWFANEWTSCASSKCVQANLAQQTRRVECRAHNGTVVPDRACNTKKPLITQICQRSECKFKWETSKWSECMPECGEAGLKTRRLRCVWQHDLSHAFTACRSLPKPIAEDYCAPPPCDNSNANRCRDRTRNCALMHRLRMCRFETFYDVCCDTCSRDNLTRIRKRNPNR